MHVCESCNRTWSTPLEDPRRCPHCNRCNAFYIPTARDIAAACAEIQAHWTAREENERRASAYRAPRVIMEAYYATRHRYDTRPTPSGAQAIA